MQHIWWWIFLFDIRLNDSRFGGKFHGIFMDKMQFLCVKQEQMFAKNVFVYIFQPWNSSKYTKKSY